MATEKNRYRDIDYAFILFLAGATYVKLYVKVAAILFYFVYLLVRKYKFYAPVSINRFYLLIPVTGTIASVLHDSFSYQGYWFGWSFGALNWLLAAAASYLLYVAVRNINKDSLHRSVKVFFAINFIISIAQLGRLIILSGHLVPYWYWEPTEYFGSSTGDHIHGLFGNISVTNAMISCLGCIYFIYKRELRWAAMCLFVLLLCTSNLTLLLFAGFAFLIFVLNNIRQIRAHVILLLMLVLFIYPVLSPDNLQYLNTVYETESTQGPITTAVSQYLSLKKTDTETDENELETAMKSGSPSLAGRINYYRMPLDTNGIISYSDELKYMEFQGLLRNKDETVAVLNPEALKRTIEKWYGIPYESTPLANYPRPIKLYTHLQTLFFLTESPVNAIFGAGIGNFSSKQALKMLGIKMQGNYPLEHVYVSKDFLRYHLYSFFHVYSLPIAEHSIINMINSVYNNIIGEYGLLGLFLFIYLYLGYFWVHRKKTGRTGWTILPLTLLFFLFDYWFEMISITVIFELLMFMDIYKDDVAEQ